MRPPLVSTIGQEPGIDLVAGRSDGFGGPDLGDCSLDAASAAERRG